MAAIVAAEDDVTGGDRPVVFADLRNDPIYRDTPTAAVCGIRSYAGVPMHDAGGLVVGALTVMHTEPGRFTGATVRGLIATESVVMRLVERRRD